MDIICRNCGKIIVRGISRGNAYTICSACQGHEKIPMLRSLENVSATMAGVVQAMRTHFPEYENVFMGLKTSWDMATQNFKEGTHEEIRVDAGRNPEDTRA